MDLKNVVKVEDWEQFQVDRANAENEPDETEEAVIEETSSETVSSGGNEHGIPEHLLERSRAARERLGA